MTINIIWLIYSLDLTIKTHKHYVCHADFKENIYSRFNEVLKMKNK